METTEIKLKNRITIVEIVTHHRPEKNPISNDFRFSFLEEGDEQPYQREMNLSNEWIDIDSGWLRENVVLVVIENKKFSPGRIPTAEQKQEMESKIIEVGINYVSDPTPEKSRTMFDPPKFQGIIPFTFIPVGENFRFRPYLFPSLRLRCTGGKHKVMIHCYPKNPVN